VEQQQPEERPLFRASERDLLAILGRLERAEDPKLDARLSPPLGAL
jgi:hypothetical protein